MSVVHIKNKRLSAFRPKGDNKEYSGEGYQIKEISSKFLCIMSHRRAMHAAED